ncbi:coiled-coil alpha-helical rod protein 1 isoform X2 [Protopterus annectens]|uniref:coiled-coil alpha-helical rod protein 1 isoform X2 n=1 Tax=Protopterus annectens TaxID=7888 RepID=UPI001CF9B483|nr:coiled-coil alpha-helical rod protein 1 isoform X2 [Protopterus annectens]
MVVVCTLLLHLQFPGKPHTLMPPSHFRNKLPTSSVPGLPGMDSHLDVPLLTSVVSHPRKESPTVASVTVLPESDPWAAFSKSTSSLDELRQENEHLKELLKKTEKEALKGRTRNVVIEASAQSRSHDHEGESICCKHAQEIFKQAEIISQHIRDIHSLDAELKLLKSSNNQQASEIKERDATIIHLQANVRDLQAELCQVRLQHDLEAEKSLLLHQTEVEKLKSQQESQQEKLQIKWQSEVKRLEACLVEEREQARSRTEALRGELVHLTEKYKEELANLQEKHKAAIEKMDRNGQKLTYSLQEQLQEAERQHQQEVLQLSEAHKKEIGVLHQAAANLREELKKNQEIRHVEVTSLKEALHLASAEKEGLQEKLNKVLSELNSQNSVVQQLRTYIGELVPDERRTAEWQREKQDLANAIQHLEKEREALKATAELQHIRLTSLQDILNILEADLGRKVPLDLASWKGQPLLTRWREKVFALMVQLKSEEISNKNGQNQLQHQMSELKAGLESSGQQQAMLLHSLQEKTAALEMERVHNRTLQEELTTAQDVAFQLQSRANQYENVLLQLKEAVNSFYTKYLEQEAELKAAITRLNNLGQRLSFATKRIDTIQGLLARKEALIRLQLQEKREDSENLMDRVPYEGLQSELRLLSDERDRLSAELKRSSQIIEEKVTEARKKFEAELRDHQATIQVLQDIVEEKTLAAQQLTQQVNAAEQQKNEVMQEMKEQLQEASETIENLKVDLSKHQEKYEKALQEKVSEVEIRLHQQLKEMEKCVQNSRREHTKAVVALRQMERQTTRDKERAQEMRKLQEEVLQQEIQHLTKQLQELERDRNLLTATLRQEGLLDQYRKKRTAPLKNTVGLFEEPQLVTQSFKPKAAGPMSKDLLSSVLEDLQALSTAVNKEDKCSTDEDEEEKR